MIVKKLIRFLLRRRDRLEGPRAKLEVLRATSDEDISRIKEALLRTSASQERAMKLLAKLDRGEQGET